MATLRARKTSDGETRWHVQVRVKGFPPQTASFRSKTDAKRWGEQTETAIRKGKYFASVEARKHTLGDLIDRYLRDVLPSKKDRDDVERHLRWWKKEIGAYVLADVTSALIGHRRDNLKNGRTRGNMTRSPGTVNRYLGSLSRAISVAVREWGWLEANPVSRVAKLKEPRGRSRFLSNDQTSSDGKPVDSELDRLFTACKESANAQLHTIVFLAVSTGMRQGEILSLRWTDIDFVREQLVLRETKNGEVRVVPLKGKALQLMKDHGKVRRLGVDLVFPSSRNPKRPTSLRSAWLTACKRANVHDFRFHDLRHSAASYLAMSGASPAEIAEVLGHKTLQMVKRYAHLSEAHTAGLVATMNERFLG